MAGYDMAYVALVAREADAAAAFFGETIGLQRTDMTAGGNAAGGRTVPVFGVGRSAVAVFAPDHPFLDAPARPGVHHMALAAEDPAGAAARHDLPAIEPERVEGLGGAAQVLIDPKATCGIRTRFCAPLNVPVAGGAPVERIDHLGIASAGNDEGIRVFSDNLGCAIESTQTDLEIQMTVESFTSDKYPAVHHSRPSWVVGGLRDVFITIGDCELEFLQDYDPNMAPAETRHDQAGNTKGDQSAIARYVSKFGPGLHHIAFKTGDIGALLPRLRDAGYRMLDVAGRPGGRASLIGFVHPSNFGGGLVIHFVEREEL